MIELSLPAILFHPLFGLLTPRLAVLTLVIFGLSIIAVWAEVSPRRISPVGCYMPSVMDKPLNGEDGSRTTIRFEKFQILPIHIRNYQFLPASLAFHFSDTGVHSEFFFQFCNRHISELGVKVDGLYHFALVRKMFRIFKGIHQNEDGPHLADSEVSRGDNTRLDAINSPPEFLL